MTREDYIDCNLWSQFKKGDKDAFAKLYRQHSISLISYGSKICSDREILKDTIQDLFIELWHSRENLAHVDSPEFYLLKALRYKLIRAEKKRNQQNPLSVVYKEDIFNGIEMPVENDIVEKETSALQVHILQKAVQSLTKRQQEIIQLRFYQGFTNEQIAALMEMNYQSVSNLLYTALCRIKKNLQKPSVFASVLSAAFSLFF